MKRCGLFWRSAVHCFLNPFSFRMSRAHRFLLVVACFLPWVAGAFLFAWVLAHHFPADGRLTMDVPLDGRSPWFEAFLPGQRASSLGLQPEGWVGQRIRGEPVYARLRLPGAYESAEVRVEFRPNDQPLIELGVERGPENAATYELSPLWSRELTRNGYRPLSVGPTRWLVPPTVTVADLQRPNDARLFWHATGTTASAWMDQGPAIPRVVSSSLRGAHDFFFVPVDGRIDVTFALQDVNRSRAHSTATFRLMRDQELLWSAAVSFGGEQDHRPTAVTQKRLAFDALPPGVYRLSFLADDSIFIRAWTTTAKRWVIGPRVYFADEVGYSTSTPSVAVWTNSYHTTVKTLHNEGLQTVSLGQTAQVAVTSTHTAFSLTRGPTERSGNVSLRAPRGNVWTLGDGYVSWTPEALFFPTPRRLTDDTALVEEGIQAVATTYEDPVPLGDGWYAGTIRVRLDPGQDRLKLALAAPGIARRDASVDIRRIVVTYERPPSVTGWWTALQQELARAWRRW